MVLLELGVLFHRGPSINYVVLAGGRGVAPKTIYYVDLT